MEQRLPLFRSAIKIAWKAVVSYLRGVPLHCLPTPNLSFVVRAAPS
jgi:hypothetical protein